MASDNLTFPGYYPPPAFAFAVAVAGTSSSILITSLIDAAFQEASGLEASIELETVIEGGENRFAHQLPGVTKSPNLVLKRGYVILPSFLSDWAAKTVGSTLNAPIVTQTIVVMLLSPARVPLVSWNFDRAWPVRWVTGPFDSQKNEVLTETLEFSYASVTRFPAMMP